MKKILGTMAMVGVLGLGQNGWCKVKRILRKPCIVKIFAI